MRATVSWTAADPAVILRGMPYDARTIFMDLSLHNQNANREIYTVCGRLTGPARERDTGSWFGSLHGILNHALVGDIFWMQRFLPLSPDSPVLNSPALHPHDLSWRSFLHDDFDRMQSCREEVDGLLCNWFDEFPPSEYEKNFEYRDSKGAVQKAAAGKAFEFLFLHQAHHRGQVSQVLDELGLPNNILDNTAYIDG